MAEPIVRVTRYEVCCLPEGDVNARHFTLAVEYRRDGLWAVTSNRGTLGRDGAWSHGYSWRDGSLEPTTDEDFREVQEGQDTWRAEHWHNLDTALRLAKEAAPHVTVNGWTLDALRERRADRG